jgi:hypothetical protein
MKNRKHKILINYNEKSKIQSFEDYIKVKDLKIRDSTRIYDSDRIPGATDKGTHSRANVIGTLMYVRVKAYRNIGLV